ncbi:MAG: calcium-binding protein, partial [Candidatus Accumulibacter sp.]|nr:calcium-binding protein [Accumulibacter sp.]
GNNVMDGAGGNDTVSYAYATSGVSVNLAIGKAQATGGSGTDTLKNVENLVGSNFNDDLRGDTAANQLDGGNGNDSLNGSAGADTMVGGDGTDYYYVDDAGDVVVESNANPASGGNDLVYSYVYSYTLTDNVERLRILNPGSCFATGNSLDNTLYAGDGNNVMNGAGGNDTVSYAYATSGVDVSLATGKAQVTGGSGTDTLKNVENLAGSRFGDYLGGNNAANELAGGNGNDTLNGGLGNDTLIGGAGSDTIRFDTLLDALNNNDTITDFNVVADRIELENAIFASLTSTGTLAAGSFHSGVGVSATDADDFILYDSSSGALSYDADGNGAGAAVQFATLASGLALSSADFLVT